jgi:hypothetical protein
MSSAVGEFFPAGAPACLLHPYEGKGRGENPRPQRAGGEPPPLRRAALARPVRRQTAVSRAKKIGDGLLPTAGDCVEIICRAIAAVGVAMLLARLPAVAADLPGTLRRPASAERRMLLRRAFGRTLGMEGMG